MLRIPDAEIERFLEEDVPYGDATTEALGIGGEAGVILFTAREPLVASGVGASARALELCGARVTGRADEGDVCEMGTTLLTAEGTAAALHAGWKVALNLMENASGIATRTRRLVEAARRVAPGIRIATTRKTFPGTKKLAIQAVEAGGGVPHRLGLSETILVFRQHRAFLKEGVTLRDAVERLRRRLPETTVVVEAESGEEALLAVESGADVVQVDKVPPADLRAWVPRLRAVRPQVRLSATGGIGAQNAADYAATGVDFLVTSSVYFGKPADIGVTLRPLG